MTDLPIGARHEIAGNKLGAINVQLQQELRKLDELEPLKALAETTAKVYPGGLEEARRVYDHVYKILYLDAAANATEEQE